MQTALYICTAILGVLLIIVIFLLLSNKKGNALQIGEDRLHEELTYIINQQAESERRLKEDITSLRNFSTESEKRLKEELNMLRNAQALLTSDANDKLMQQVIQMQKNNDMRMEEIRRSVDNRMAQMQDSNEKRLDQMRNLVDEKLTTTLEGKLNDSFKQVSERLEMVHKGLGEMQALANGVGDLKKVLSNIKIRGTWGEIQLGNILEQILAPNQYEQNVATKPSSPGNRVEYAVKLPGKDDNSVVWLPIDSKFPLADYQALIEARENGDTDSATFALHALEKRIKAEAKDIRDKYLEPPFTTDFGILFLPVEGLYSEILSRYDLCEQLQNEYRVIVSGPATLTALLNSLQMGFRTLAIEKRSQEVWHLLEAVRTSFDQFGAALEKTRKKLAEASNTIENASKKTNKISRQLKKVGELPMEEAEKILQLNADDDGDIDKDSEEENYD